MAKKIILITVGFYKKLISPFINIIFGDGCRFYPSCADYSINAIEKHGVVYGISLAIKRVSQCNPLSKRPHFDPVPNSY